MKALIPVARIARVPWWRRLAHWFMPKPRRFCARCGSCLPHDDAFNELHENVCRRLSDLARELRGEDDVDRDVHRSAMRRMMTPPWARDVPTPERPATRLD